MAGFDISSIFNSAPSSGTDKKEIVYVHIDDILDDPRNVYRIDEIEELAASIELVGLQQPLNLRPDDELASKYRIISGHRRKAAHRLLVDEGKQEYASIPSIIDNAPGSAAMQELKLILGNANTRKLSSWELSKQAERVQELFYQLKEEGVEFPGRMRDHVAAACQVSKSKLSRLKVIREQLEIFVERWQDDTLSEALAYELAQCSVDLQWRIRDLKIKPEKLQADKVKRVREEWERGARWEMEHLCTVSGKTCGHGDAALRRDLNAASWEALCKGKECCLKCRYGLKCKGYSGSCDRLCKVAADKKAAAKAAENAKEAAEAEKERTKALAEFVATIRPYIKAMEAAGVDKIAFDYGPIKLEDLRLWIDEPEKCTSKWALTDLRRKTLVSLADKLGCSVDFLLGRTEVMGMAKASSEPQWKTGQPPQEGDFWCKIRDARGMEWTDEVEYSRGRWKVREDEVVAAWWPLPEG